MCSLQFLYCSSYSYMKTEMKAFIDERMHPERRVLYALPSRYPLNPWLKKKLSPTPTMQKSAYFFNSVQHPPINFLPSITSQAKDPEQNSKKTIIYYCTLKNKSSPLLVGVSFGTQPGVFGNSVLSNCCPVLASYSSLSSPLPLPNIGLQPSFFASSISSLPNTRHFPPRFLSSSFFKVRAWAFCSPRRFARREEEVEILEFVEYWDTLEEERVNVMEG
jgi:hypothetical protein